MTQAAAPEPTQITSPNNAGAGDVRLTLNTFQRLMRQWKSLGPYNAAQIVQVTGTGDLERWRRAAEETIVELGLGRPEFAGEEHVVFRAGGAVEVARVSVGLQTHLNVELNRGFGAGEFPIRFFLLAGTSESEGESHCFAAVYDHWIADSRAMRDLMQRIFVRYRGGDGEAGLPRLTLAGPPQEGLFGWYSGRLSSWAVAIWTSVGNLVKHRPAFRSNLIDPLDFTSRMVYRALPEGAIEGLHRFAKSHGGSVNDGFLALLGQTMGAYSAPSRYRKRGRQLHHFQRDRVGLGTIVDIRDAATTSLAQVFGLYLSSYTVLLKEPERRTAADVLLEIAAKTRRIKRSKAALKAFVALQVPRICWGIFTKPKVRAQFFHKQIPLLAGISNVNMSGSWVDTAAGDGKTGEPRVLDYLRVSPTGPLLPLVFTLTTIGRRLSLCVTYRTTAFTDAQAEAVIDDFVRRLGEVAR